MNSKNKVLLLGLILSIALTSVYYEIKTKIHSNTSNNVKNYGVVTSTENSLQNKNLNNSLKNYTNSYLGISFSIPTGWHIASISNEETNLKVGQVQIFNYDETLSPGKDSMSSDSKNKIESYISDADKYIESSDYPSESINYKKVILNDIEINTSIVQFSTGKFKTYYIPMKNKPGKYFSISISGDQNNFYILDNLVSSLRQE